MREQYPSKLLENAVYELSKLPGVGNRTALKLALHLLRRPAEEGKALADSIQRLVGEVHYCKVCHNISDTETCEICANPTRDRSIICVVENIRNVMSIEHTGVYHGLYHVLGGVISPIEGIGPQDLAIESLLERIATGTVKEVIFALNPTMEGDTTNFFITRRLQGASVRLTTLARGITVGDDLEYADETTLGRSIVNRVNLT